MPASDIDQEKARQDQELRVQRQIAFASGLFQGDVTVRTLLESLAEGVVVIDNSGTILLVNAAAEQMFGYQRKELIGMPQAVLIPERFHTVHKEHQAGYFAEPRIKPMNQHFDLTGRRRDGSEFPVEISLSYIETINGVLVMGLISDITLRKQIETRLRESEEQFHIQVEGVQDYAIFSLDTEGNVLNWNAGAERLKGYRADEIIGAHFSCFYPEEERNAGKPEAELKKASAEGRFADEGWRVSKDGSRFWADVIITAQYDESGNLRGFSKVTHDITGRKKAADALRFSEARYRALFHDNPTMIVTLDADLTMISVNPFCASQLGYTIDELEGKSVLILFHEDDRAAVADQLRMCLQNPNQVNRWQYRKLRKDGRILWVEETAQAVYDLVGTLNLLVVCQDVTERKRVEEALKNSEEKLRYASTAADIGIWHWDLVNNELTWSERCNEFFSFPPGYPITYAAFLQSIHEEDRQRIDEAVQKALQGKTEYFVEMRVVLSEAQMRWVMAKGRGFYDDQGKPIRMHGIVMDITARKQAEEALRKSEKKFLTVFHAVPAMLGITTLADGIFIDVNETCMRILGYHRDEVIGHTTMELGIWESQADRDRAIRALEEHGTIRDMEINLKGKIGERFVGLMSVEFIDIDGERYILSMINDITERKRMEEEIERLNVSQTARAADLEDANRELEAFNYTVAHDLRNPLNVISSYCQVIKELCSANLGEECRRYIQETYDGTLRMNRLIEALLNFSRLAHVELTRERVDLGSMAREVVEELKGTETARRIKFLIADGIVIDGDANLMRVVLANLIGNAWKYTGATEDAVIEFGSKDIDGKPVFFVRDNGAGFNMADTDKLFAPFQRLPGAEECRGFGIGLATVERIIRRHGGKAWGEGVPGKGATFYFTVQANMREQTVK